MLTLDSAGSARIYAYNIYNISLPACKKTYILGSGTMTDNTEKNRILIVEDDLEIVNVVAMNLESIGLSVDCVHDGRNGLLQAQSGHYKLVILDIMLPQLDGLSVCRQLREKDPFTPILMLTAKTEEIDRVLGLELGADDYLAKPFSMRELIARVKALLRRAAAGTQAAEHTETAGKELKLGSLHIDFEKHRVTRKGEPIDLTVKEFELLSVFASNPGRAYSRADLLNIVWGYNFEGYEHTVNTHINRLRSKLEDDPSKPEYLQTVWGIGYRFAEEAGETL